jgi:hypothetical protein
MKAICSFETPRTTHPTMHYIQEDWNPPGEEGFCIIIIITTISFA